MSCILHIPQVLQWLFTCSYQWFQHLVAPFLLFSRYLSWCWENSRWRSISPLKRYHSITLVQIMSELCMVSLTLPLILEWRERRRQTKHLCELDNPTDILCLYSGCCNCHGVFDCCSNRYKNGRSVWKGPNSSHSSKSHEHWWNQLSIWVTMAIQV